VAAAISAGPAGSTRGGSEVTRPRPSVVAGVSDAPALAPQRPNGAGWRGAAQGSHAAAPGPGTPPRPRGLA
jgi:hypothetical protein